MCAANLRQKLPMFWNWSPKNVSKWLQCVQFQKSQKSAKSLHPNTQYSTPLYTVRIAKQSPLSPFQKFTFLWYHVNGITVAPSAAIRTTLPAIRMLFAILTIIFLFCWAWRSGFLRRLSYFTVQPVPGPPTFGQWARMGGVGWGGGGVVMCKHCPYYKIHIETEEEVCAKASLCLGNKLSYVRIWCCQWMSNCQT